MASLWRFLLLAIMPYSFAEEASLQLDDECLDESCTLNALQLRGAAAAVPVVPDIDDIIEDPDDEEEEEDDDEDEEDEEDGGKPAGLDDHEDEEEEDGPNPDEASDSGIPAWEPLPEDANCSKPDAQCGGQWYYGPTCCWHGHLCYQVNEYYSQCVTKDKAEELADAASEPSTTTTTTNADPQGCQIGYGQCGGFDEDTKTNWTGSTCCHAGFICSEKSKFFSQCKPMAKGGPFMPYKPTKALEEPSDAPVFTFYVYRASSEEGSDLLDNINVGNLAGTLWYLQNEVVFVRPRKFNISKIVRYKISTKSTTPLYDLGMNFGVRFAYDSAQCDGPWSCDLNYDRFGYFVGCNNLGSFPFPTYDIHYPGAKWYALPGPCSSKTYQDKDAKCIKEQPGGRCDGTPTGQGNCTYSIEVVGSLTIDEIDGIKDYHEFIHTGGVEFNKTLDKGEGCTFWNNMNVTAKNIERVEKVRALFEKKYPDQPLDEDMEAPACDFNFTAFYGKDPSYLTTTAAPTTEAATTEAPTTTEAATTEAETTEAATTEVATTEAETMEPATTEAETTEAPTTEAETTVPETTEAETTEAETTETATTEAETTEAETTEAETTEAETTEAETTEAETTEEPVPEETTKTALSTPAGCKDAEFGTHCYSAVTWAKEHGLKLHPTWYPGLTSSSPFSDFQARVHHVNPKDCPLPCTKDAGCHTAVAGEHCYSAVKWAMKSGITQHPTWYKGLTKESSFHDFQVAVHKATPKKCPMPCEA
ncbi:unnamed protein product [Durusdinium trenchii]|uniref:CBM1 domain-containing protein n=1 Tax=Durusdinium trenchii TaxID=1381693 RepID=A0ABP0MI91_9DINO